MLLKDSILKTLIYADIFDYPLLSEEILKWFITNRHAELVSASLSELKKILKQVQDDKRLSKFLSKKDGYYYLRGREHIVAERKKRNIHSKEKIKIAQQVSSFLRLIPTVQLVGITGALAMENADRDDDIDLFIITSSDFLWTTRFFVTLLIQLIGMRRVPGQERVKDKICLNMYVDEDHLAMPKTERNLFTAHEVLQMKPLWERNNMYRKFISTNSWVKKFLPNAFANCYCEPEYSGEAISKIKPFLLLETLLKKFQLWYMRNRRTSEKISDGIIRFHPQDVSRTVLAMYKKEITRFGIT